MKINNRRYIGCKTKLLNFIEETIDNYHFDENSIFADIFGGTGVVANLFATKGYKTIVNDTLFSNVVAYKAYLGKGNINGEKMNAIITKYNSINPDDLEENYFSKILPIMLFIVYILIAAIVSGLRLLFKNKKSEK